MSVSDTPSAQIDRTLRAHSASFLETIQWVPIRLSDGLKMCMRRVVHKEWKAKTTKKNQDTHVLCAMLYTQVGHCCVDTVAHTVIANTSQ